jgi:hypothetical protein
VGSNPGSRVGEKGFPARSAAVWTGSREARSEVESWAQPMRRASVESA